MAAWLATFCIVVLTGCASDRRIGEQVDLSPAEARAIISRLLPPNTADRSGWATDIYAALAVMDIAPTPEDICAVVAVTEQESTFRTDPPVPGLAAIAWKEIDIRAEHAGVPPLVVRTALRLTSPNGKSYRERLDAVKTEKELSEIFEDFIGMVPMGKTFFANRNPVHTGGPMQVSVAFAEAHAAARTYPYPVDGTIRHEVFTRRGGMYFGIAHLLDYPASYDKYLYRFADFNAGHYASRNAAFQNAVSAVSGIPLELDGDLMRYGKDAERGAGATELATSVLAKRLNMSVAAIRRDLERSGTQDFERTRLYERMFSLADRLHRRPVPRAVVPHIRLQSPKITGKLTTEWFADRVDERHKRCLMRHSPKNEEVPSPAPKRETAGAKQFGPAAGHKPGEWFGPRSLVPRTTDKLT
jgi:hypothetical protein